MQSNEKINILLVDDQPAKLMSLEAILTDLGENVIKANCADEALKELLTRDIAVVLVDVCMPGMDGFELAEMIRGHPRCRRTAIIFASAVHLSDADRLKGYHLGAVDYIPVPIIPEVLRAKVAVFADLFRKTEQLHRLNRELEDRVSERTADLTSAADRLRASEQRYKRLVHGLPAAVYTCDADGRVTLFNAAAAELWGREPTVGEELWCGSWRIYRLDGTVLPLEDCPMVRTPRTGVPVRDEEIIIERPDGTRRNIVPYPEPLFDSAGNLVGAINMLMDVTERRSVEALRAHLAAIVEYSDDAILSKDLTGQITSWNSAAERMFGFRSAEMLGKPVAAIIPDERLAEEMAILERLRKGEPIEHLETLRVAKDGRVLHVSVTISPIRDSFGRVTGASTIVRDISEQKRVEEILARDRDMLEQIVAERTEELLCTNERLRIADRMATIGTLSAGLGHDMANLLLPVRMRLDIIQSADVAATVAEDLEAIRKACEYLQRLASSLRLLALDPEAETNDEMPTDLEHWWRDVEGMVRNGLPRTTALESSFDAGLPHVRMGRAALTQIVFNLVQNAGDALKGRPDGVVSVTARADADSVRFLVSDNGPGMSEETQRRCLEPFFTTKTRGLSTGLGLALVSGIVKRAGGTIALQSAPGSGTTFVLELPRAMSVGSEAKAPQRHGCVAVVTMKDLRLRAHVESVLTSLAYEVRNGASPDGADVWITETNGNGDADAARRFADGDPRRRAVVIGPPSSKEDEDGVSWIERAVKLSMLRARLLGLLAEERPVRATAKPKHAKQIAK